MTQPRLMLTGDDFGVSTRVNEAVERLHQAGALTHASLMVNENAVEEAVRIARRNPRLGMNLHLTLCDGRAATRGRLPASPLRAGLRYALDPRARGPLAAEIAAQFRRFAELGLAPGRWDGHTHLHLHPAILAATLPVARAHGFRSTRLVREPGGRYPLAGIFRALSAAATPSLRAAGIGANEHLFGLRETGRVTTAVVLAWLRAVPAHGTTELYFHPGAEPELLDPAPIADFLAAQKNGAA